MYKNRENEKLTSEKCQKIEKRKFKFKKKKSKAKK